MLSLDYTKVPWETQCWVVGGWGTLPQNLPDSPGQDVTPRSTASVFFFGMLQVHSYQCFPLNTGQRWQPEQQLSGAKPIRLPGGHLQTWFASGSVEFSYSCLIWGNKGFSGGSMVRNLPANARDIRGMGLIPTSGRSPGGRHGNPLQYSCLEYPMDRITRTSGLETFYPMSPIS